MENERNNWRWRLKSNGNEDDGRSSELNLAGKLQTRLPTDGHCISRRQVVMVGPHAYTHSTHTSLSSSFSSVRLSLSLPTLAAGTMVVIVGVAMAKVDQVRRIKIGEKYFSQLLQKNKMIKGLPEIAGVLWKQRIQSTSSLLLPSNPSAARQRERYEGDRRADAIARQRERYEGDRRVPGRSRRPSPPVIPPPPSLSLFLITNPSRFPVLQKTRNPPASSHCLQPLTLGLPLPRKATNFLAGRSSLPADIYNHHHYLLCFFSTPQSQRALEICDF
ncbi:hypothetical protein LXL04_034073 [Taraxacum kok-saghyz]